MRAARCPCGSLASFLRACKVCGRSLHLAHGHPPEDDPDHFERIKHEWFYTGGTHAVVDERGFEVDDEPCPYVHGHARPFADHEHEPGYEPGSLADRTTVARNLGREQGA